jgi:hypothetical protein
MRRAAGTSVPDSFEPISELLAQYRTDVVRARIALAADDISPERRDWLWQLIDCREWLIKLLTKDFPAQLEQIDRELEAALRRQA